MLAPCVNWLRWFRASHAKSRSFAALRMTSLGKGFALLSAGFRYNGGV
jgi:hypothetical protein